MIQNQILCDILFIWKGVIMLKAITIKDDEKFLRQVSSIVDFNDKELHQNLQDIREYCTFNSGLYAMACIQLGIPKRMFSICASISLTRSSSFLMVADISFICSKIGATSLPSFFI